LKLLSTVVICAVLALGSAPAFAQMTVGANGSVVDGHGGAGNKANRYRPDGPAPSFQTITDPRFRQEQRMNDVAAECRRGSMEPSWCYRHGYLRSSSNF
jgi:hypothetical protein